MICQLSSSIFSRVLLFAIFFCFFTFMAEGS